MVITHFTYTLYIYGDAWSVGGNWLGSDRRWKKKHQTSY